MSKPRFAIRTIQDGQVQINGNVYVPDSKWKEYDGRLDGIRYAFGLYYIGNEWQAGYVAMWGTESDFRNPGPPYERGPEVMADGTLPWDWWYLKKEDS